MSRHVIIIAAVCVAIVWSACSNPEAFMRGWNRQTCVSTEGAYCP